MDNASPEVWRWIWLVAAGLFGIGELSVAGSFFLAPFAVGALVAAILAFADVDLAIEWIVFVAVSVAALAALRPLARRLDREGSGIGIGAGRQIGQTARVIDTIDPVTHAGSVRLGAETWRAEAGDGHPIPAGELVSVIRVRGTRLIVEHTPDAPPPEPA